MDKAGKNNTTDINTIYKNFKNALNITMRKNSMKVFFQLMDKLDLDAECMFGHINDFQIALFETFYIILYNLALKTSYKVASDSDLSDTNLLRKDMIDNAIDHVLEPRVLLKVWDREAQYRCGYLVNTLRNHFLDQIRSVDNDLYVSLEQQERYELDMLMYSKQKYEFSFEMVMEQEEQKLNEVIYGKALYKMNRHYMYDLLNWASMQKSLELVVCNYLCNFKLLC